MGSSRSLGFYQSGDQRSQTRRDETRRPCFPARPGLPWPKRSVVSCIQSASAVQQMQWLSPYSVMRAFRLIAHHRPTPSLSRAMQHTIPCMLYACLTCFSRSSRLLSTVDLQASFTSCGCFLPGWHIRCPEIPDEITLFLPGGLAYAAAAVY